ncbi:hypothetical protein ASPWEDRAFT_37527 [Aspergillus wentii DTO 134E9]|uniref:Major facilitator superfamily (MFS) profile domain-containing protein n=1 Tax=Aspergillus wentii DTO 134E9 TaxID=1073089 RepID=A0A1L9RXQ5_ASPWE|nr:uncharacterized protein ASPWEDRAFT_37527 [Aspergillus wentii DTO 134E9]OJJ39695.1 hypothetical protein ASPWEDRAFT_37527 [Aspergillus wentii DTO 134E9]
MYKVAKHVYQKARGTPQPPTWKPLCQHQRRPESRLIEDAASRNSTTSEPNRQPCQACKQQQHDSRVYRWKLICGLLLPYILSTLDLTIVATAVPFIASHFDKFDQLNWIVTAFTLTSTTFIPTFGQLADVFGRHAALQLSMFLMLIGSVLCAVAQSWGMLLLGRALQGTSSAGIMNVIMIVMADKVSLKENAKNNSIFAFIGGLGYGVGPVVGGYLTDANWRYCFVIPIPIAVLAHIAIYVLLRNELIEGTHFKKGSRWSSILPALATLDIFGTILFIFGIGLVILGTAWGGSTYAWSAPQVLAPLIVGGVCFVLFFLYEYLLESGRFFARMFPKQVPMLPYSMFARIDTLWLAIIQFAAGAAMYSVFYFVGVYFTLVEAYPASKAGIQLLYYIPGLGAGVYLAVYMCNIRPAQTFWPITFGTFAETAGLAVVTWAISTQNTGIINGMMVLAGAGTGARFMPDGLHTSGIWPERIAPAMSLMRFALPFGGTMALTIMGSVFNNKLSSAAALAGGGSSSEFNVHDANSLSFIDALPSAQQALIRNVGKDAIMWAFIAIMPIMGISLVAGLFMGNAWIKPKSRENDEEKSAINDEQQIGYSEVIYVPYLWALMKGNIDSYKRISKPLSAEERQQQAHEQMELRQLGLNERRR